MNVAAKPQQDRRLLRSVGGVEERRHHEGDEKCWLCADNRIFLFLNLRFCSNTTLFERAASFKTRFVAFKISSDAVNACDGEHIKEEEGEASSCN